jgi:cytochrome c-type biogenesis protein CcmF
MALFAAIYAVVANAGYIWIGLNGKLKAAGGSVAHLGFAVMILGMLIASGNKKTISDNTVTGINIPFAKDEKGNSMENPLENLTMLRDVPTRMLDYSVTYSGDSAGNEAGRVYHKLKFVKKDSSEQFELTPDVYVGKEELKSSNPGTKRYLTKDIYTYISSINPESNREDTGKFVIKELAEGDTTYYSKGYMILNKVVKNPNNDKYHFTDKDAALMADITLVTKDSMRYKASPLIQVVQEADGNTIAIQTDDTLYAQNLYLKFAGVTENRKIKLGIKESDRIIDFITLKAYLFPYINLVWLGLVVMAIGLAMSMIQRAKLKPVIAVAIIVFVAVSLFYMFFVAGG